VGLIKPREALSKQSRIEQVSFTKQHVGSDRSIAESTVSLELEPSEPIRYTAFDIYHKVRLAAPDLEPDVEIDIAEFFRFTAQIEQAFAELVRPELAANLFDSAGEPGALNRPTTHVVSLAWLNQDVDVCSAGCDIDVIRPDDRIEVPSRHVKRADAADIGIKCLMAVMRLEFPSRKDPFGPQSSSRRENFIGIKTGLADEADRLHAYRCSHVYTQEDVSMSPIHGNDLWLDHRIGVTTLD
jgi:hypothetical protein